MNVVEKLGGEQGQQQEQQPFFSDDSFFNSNGGFDGTQLPFLFSDADADADWGLGFTGNNEWGSLIDDYLADETTTTTTTEKDTIDWNAVFDADLPDQLSLLPSDEFFDEIPAPSGGGTEQNLQHKLYFSEEMNEDVFSLEEIGIELIGDQNVEGSSEGRLVSASDTDPVRVVEAEGDELREEVAVGQGIHSRQLPVSSCSGGVSGSGSHTADDVEQRGELLANSAEETDSGDCSARKAGEKDANPLAKKRKRQLMNRESACRSRERKKEYVKDLEMKRKYLEFECQRLHQLLAFYCAENHSLRLHVQQKKATDAAIQTRAMNRQESAVLHKESLPLGSLSWLIALVCLIPCLLLPWLLRGVAAALYLMDAAVGPARRNEERELVVRQTPIVTRKEEWPDGFELHELVRFLRCRCRTVRTKMKQQQRWSLFLLKERRVWKFWLFMGAWQRSLTVACT